MRDSAKGRSDLVTCPRDYNVSERLLPMSTVGYDRDPNRQRGQGSENTHPHTATRK